MRNYSKLKGYLGVKNQSKKGKVSVLRGGQLFTFDIYLFTHLPDNNSLRLSK